MKQYILIALRLTLVCIIVFVTLYTLVILGVAQAGPNHGKGETVSVNNKIVGYTLEGQLFTADKYFNGRPSAAGYNAAASSGSNKGPSNPEYLKQVQDRIDTFLAHNPGISKTEIPSELLTASGSGLDPDLSPTAARIQVKRIAATRGIDAHTIDKLIDQNIVEPLLGILGPSKVNVLQLNILLDQLTPNNKKELRP